MQRLSYCLLPTPPARTSCPTPVQRQHIFEWVRAMLAVTLGVAAHGGLPPIYMQRHAPDPATQLSEFELSRPLLEPKHAEDYVWC
jgi:hypothetical protein